MTELATYTLGFMFHSTEMNRLVAGNNNGATFVKGPSENVVAIPMLMCYLYL